MSKIVQAVNAMISNPEKITCVSKSFLPEEQEYYFLYKGKYKWSITVNDTGGYSLFYYADDMNLADIKQASLMNWQQLSFIAYKTQEINTKEAFESFSELFRIIAEKALGVDDMLKDIISDMEDDLPF